MKDWALLLSLSVLYLCRRRDITITFLLENKNGGLRSQITIWVSDHFMIYLKQLGHNKAAYLGRWVGAFVRPLNFDVVKYDKCRNARL